MIRDATRAFSLPLVEEDDVEADDMIASYARAASAAGWHVTIVSSDKDLMQLVEPSIDMFDTMKNERIRAEEVYEKFGVEPERVGDVLALMGDSVDNVPGIFGIGPKTAQKLIADFGSIENLLANTASLKGKQKESLEANTDKALLSKELATIITDCPLEVTWDDLVLSPRDDEAVKQLFTDFEFRTLTKRLFGDDAGRDDSPSRQPQETTPTLFDTFKTIKDVPHTYHLADTRELQAKLFTALAAQPSFCFDIETTSLDRHAANSWASPSHGTPTRAGITPSTISNQPSAI
jgi:DNA polymerase-1